MSKESNMEKLWEQDQGSTLQEGGGDLAELNKKVKKLEGYQDQLEKLEEEVQMRYQLPDNFYVGWDANKFIFPQFWC